MKPRLILASGSPRRQELLAEAGIEFEIARPRVHESANRSLTIRELTRCNALRKALAITQLHPACVILAADTLVALDGQTIGKPRDLADARAILRQLSGREHQVCTGVCLVRQNRLLNFEIVSRVEFHPLSDAQIREYLAKISPLDKAGAYAAQGAGREIIRRLRGSYSNVIGLPMEETLPALAEFGIKPAANDGKSPACSRPDPQRKTRSNPECSRGKAPAPRALAHQRA
ncbi:MAG: Maf family protein [Chthoniobacterales bacterium]